jgi:hypothetical protein
VGKTTKSSISSSLEDSLLSHSAVGSGLCPRHLREGAVG